MILLIFHNTFWFLLCLFCYSVSCSCCCLLSVCYPLCIEYAIPLTCAQSIDLSPRAFTNFKPTPLCYVLRVASLIFNSTSESFGALPLESRSALTISSVEASIIHLIIAGPPHIFRLGNTLGHNARSPSGGAHYKFLTTLTVSATSWTCCHRSREG